MMNIFKFLGRNYETTKQINLEITSATWTKLIKRLLECKKIIEGYYLSHAFTKTFS